MKIVFVGAPGSGKTTLTAAVFAALKESGRRTELVSEWIRTDIALSGPMTSIWEQYRTRRHQEELEAAVPKEIDHRRWRVASVFLRRVVLRSDRRPATHRVAGYVQIFSR